MSPQDPQNSQPLSADPNAAAPVQPATDLSAQIPPSYAPAASSSPLDEALNATLAAPEPDPMAGFNNPAVQAAPQVDVTSPAQQSSSVDATAASVAAAPAAAEPAVDMSVPAPAPTTTQAYDPSQDVGVGAPASSYPSAPEPLPPNPLEMDPASAPAAPFAAETPVTPPLVEEVPVPQPTPVEPDPVPVVPAEQPYVDAVAAPAEAGVTDAGAMPATDPTLQSMLDNPQGDPAGDGSYADATDPAVLAASSSSSSGGGKGVLMPIVIGLAVLLVGVGALALVLGKKSITDLPADSLTNQDGSPASTTIASDISVPEGYIAVNKDCYQFGIPTDNTISADDKSCEIDATFGKQATSTITVLPGTDSFDSLDKAVAAAKTTTSLTASNIVSERKISLGGFDAQEIVHNVGTTTPKNSTMVVVLLKDGKYKLDSKAITTFQIDMDSSDAFSSDAVKTLESSWTWN